MTVLGGAEGVLLLDFLPKGRIVTGEYYPSLLVQLRDQIRTKRRGKLRRGVLFHRDNAPAHEAYISMAAIHYCGFQIVNHPPFSPDLAPSDYRLFTNLKKSFRRRDFGTDDDVMSADEGFLRSQEG